MNKRRNNSAQATNRNSPCLPTKEKAKILNLDNSLRLNKPNKESPFPSGSLKILKKGQNLHLKPRSPERYRQNFDIQDVIENLGCQKSSRPFKILDYQESEVSHTRTPTTIVKEVNQSYQFVSALSSIPDSDQSKSQISIDFSDCGKESIDLKYLDISDEILSDFSFTEEGEEPKEKLNAKSSFNSNQDSTKFSIFSSLAEPKSQYLTEIRQTPSKKPIEERYSTIYTLSSDSTAKNVHTLNSERQSPYVEKLKNTLTTRVTTNTMENETEIHTEPKDFYYEKKNVKEFKLENESLGIMPTRAYCKNCRIEVLTSIKLEIPPLPLWKRLCCSNCYGSNNLDNLQEIAHYCRKCKGLIGKIQPRRIM
ncbi:unnamed protein product [Blepharisma stoltei]|uniref:LITAF domain-containing protein n=1 Tax=Blepharisma stoltei TaxID=1481888 RepID=A0AAU9JX08_9CILI|nr:unnamed protein product [Blepharisma stoltei]